MSYSGGPERTETSHPHIEFNCTIASSYFSLFVHLCLTPVLPCQLMPGTMKDVAREWESATLKIRVKVLIDKGIG